MFGQHGAVLGFQCAQFGGAFGIWFQVWHQGFAHIVWYIHFGRHGSVFDVVAVVVEVFVHVVLHLDNSRWIGRYHQVRIVFYAQTHDGVVTCVVVGNGEHFGRSGIEFFDELRAVALRYARHRPKHRAVGCIAFDDLTNDAHNRSVEHMRAVFDKVVEPHFGHFAIHIFQIYIGNGHPFRFRRCAAGGGIHIRMSRNQHIGLAIFVAFDKWSKILVVGHFHLFGIPAIEFHIVFGCQNVVEIVQTPIFRVLTVA